MPAADLFGPMNLARVLAGATPAPAPAQAPQQVQIQTTATIGGQGAAGGGKGSAKGAGKGNSKGGGKGGSAAPPLDITPEQFAGRLQSLGQALAMIDSAPTGVGAMPLPQRMLYSLAAALGGDPQGQHLADYTRRGQSAQSAARLQAMMAAAPGLGANTTMQVTADGQVALTIKHPDPTLQAQLTAALAPGIIDQLGQAGMVITGAQFDGQRVQVKADLSSLLETKSSGSAPQPTWNQLFDLARNSAMPGVANTPAGQVPVRQVDLGAWGLAPQGTVINQYGEPSLPGAMSVDTRLRIALQMAPPTAAEVPGLGTVEVRKVPKQLVDPAARPGEMVTIFGDVTPGAIEAGLPVITPMGTDTYWLQPTAKVGDRNVPHGVGHVVSTGGGGMSVEMPGGQRVTFGEGKQYDFSQYLNGGFSAGAQPAGGADTQVAQLIADLAAGKSAAYIAANYPDRNLRETVLGVLADNRAQYPNAARMIQTLKEAGGYEGRG